MVYQLSHIYRHLMDEGVGLRQLLDYYMVLRVYHNDLASVGDCTQSMGQWTEGMGLSVPSKEQLMHVIGRLVMKRFASAVMWVLKVVFGMPELYMICDVNEREGRFLLNEIMMAGNFGMYDEHIKHGGGKMSHAWEKTKHNLRFVKHYPEEALFEPWFWVYHYIWRKFSLWKF